MELTGLSQTMINGKNGSRGNGTSEVFEPYSVSHTDLQVTF